MTDDPDAPKPRSQGRLSVRPSAQPRDLMGPQSLANAWTARVISLYPEMFPGPLGGSIIGRSLRDGVWALDLIQLRNFARDKHRTVDDTPLGGGPGMVLKPDIVDAALTHAGRGTTRSRWPVIHLSPRGRPFRQADAQALARMDGVTLLCSRFEGVDQRVLDHHRVDEVSLGDFILMGGEIAAMALIEATVRLIPRVLGNAESAEAESFSDGLLEHPHYTRPVDWAGRTAPEVLLSGHHANVAAWRRDQSERLTKERRPDLWRAHLGEDAHADPVEDTELSDAHTSAAHGGTDKD